MIYLDYQATTPLDPTVRDAMLPWLGGKTGNPHAANRAGREAAAAIEVARDHIARALEAQSGRVIFTSGATEAANWAIRGALELMAPRRTIVTVATEHSCVLETARWLERQGCELRILPVDAHGLIDEEQAIAAIDDGVALVAIMAVNNEIGVMHPLARVSARARDVGALFFCDMVQGFGRMGLPMETTDIVALAAHKVHGPGGIGALWLRDGLDLPPLLIGGGQQDGLRPGTLPTALCVGFGAAADQLNGWWEDDLATVDALWRRATRAFGPDWIVNGSTKRRYRGNLNIRRDGIDANRLISEVRQVAFSAGSACASGTGRPSHVLKALGLTEPQARSSIRIGFGRFTTEAEIDEAALLINAAAEAQLEWA
jgi:cysteine desulfurase